MQLHLHAVARLKSVVPILALEYLTAMEPSDYEGEHDGSDYSVTTDGETRKLTISRNETESVLRASLNGDMLDLTFEGPTHPELGALCEALGLKSSGSGRFEAISREELATRLSDIDACRLLMARMRNHTSDEDAVVNSVIRLLTYGMRWHKNRALALGTDERRAERAEKDSIALEAQALSLKEWNVPGLKAVTLGHDARYSCLSVVIDGFYEMAVPLIDFGWPIGSLASHLVPLRKLGGGKYAITPTKVDKAVMGVLSAALIEGNTVRLTRQLDAKTYKKVNEFLIAMGGKWHTGQQAHVFDTDPSGALREILATGCIFTHKDFEFFGTAPAEVARVVQIASLDAGHKVLEPNAGQGPIAMACAEAVGQENVTVYELMPANVAHLQKLGFAIEAPCDFLSVAPEPVFDRVCMNPPFSGGRDIAHVMHAMDFLKPGGVLVSIMSTTWRQINNARSAKFREFLERNQAQVEDIAAGAFRDAGTDVATTLVRIVKPMDSHRPSALTMLKPSVIEQADLFA